MNRLEEASTLGYVNLNQLVVHLVSSTFTTKVRLVLG